MSDEKLVYKMSDKDSKKIEIENTEETNPVEKQIENIKEDEIPVDWTFNLDGKNCSFAFKGYTIKSRMPKIGDKIAIESRRSILSRGQYNSLAISIIDSQVNALNLLDAVTTLQVCCELPKDFPNRENLADADETQEQDILDLYLNYIKWQKFFRIRVAEKH